MVLLFGCRHPSDHSYKEEVEDALKLGALTNSFTAYSRIPGKPKVCLITGRFLINTVCEFYHFKHFL